MTGLKPKVATSRDFWDAYAKLPKSQRKNVWKFYERFQEDPTAASINYEPLHQMRDKNVRSVRIDQTYRAIVIHPPKDDVYLLVWVDHHDEAMAWAANKLFPVHPKVGHLQVLDVGDLLNETAPSPPLGTDAGSQKSKAPPPLVVQNGLFAAHTDDDLVWTGLPELLLPAVRALVSEEDLDGLRPYLPEDAFEGLVWLAAGGSLEELLADREQRITTTAVDPDDFAAALARPESRRRFVEISSPEELAAVLEGPLDAWRVFLHPSQERLATKNLSGPARVMGGAGTGKTVVLMHRARHLARQVFPDAHDKILVTTFTAALVDGIRQNLQALCPAELGARIEVVNLHKWAVQFLRKNGIKPVFAKEHQIQAAWKRAMALAGENLAFDAAFYAAEWRYVVRGQAITDRTSYLQASRIGRGTALTRAQRAAVWEVFVAFRQALANKGVMEWDDAFEQAEALVRAGSSPPYRAVLVDEGQDFGAPAYKLIRALAPIAPNDLFIVADAHQRLYGHKVVLGQLGIQVVGRSSTLRVNYRTTEQIRRWAVGVVAEMSPEDLDGGRQDLKGYTSACFGPAPEVQVFSKAGDEQAFLLAYLSNLLAEARPGEVCLATRRHEALARYNEALRTAGIPVATARGDDGVVLDTMHNIKGLEFKHVVMAGLSAAEFPGRADGSEPELDGSSTV